MYVRVCVCVCLFVCLHTYASLHPSLLHRALWVERYSPATRQFTHNATPCRQGDGRQHNGWTEWKEKDWKDRRQADRWRDWKDWAEKEEEQNRSQENWRSWKEWADREQEEHNEQKQREETKDAQEKWPETSVTR